MDTNSRTQNKKRTSKDSHCKSTTKLKCIDYKSRLLPYSYPSVYELSCNCGGRGRGDALEKQKKHVLIRSNKGIVRKKQFRDKSRIWQIHQSIE